MPEEAPPYTREALMMRDLVAGAWESVSTDFVNKLLALIDLQDIAGIETLLKELPALADEFASSLGTKVDTILSTLQTKAEAFFLASAVDLVGIPKDYSVIIRKMYADQIRGFCKAFPERILHPEISRQLEYLRDNPLARSIDIARITDRLSGLAGPNATYWENMTDVVAARQWHSTSVFLAQQNGITTCYVTGPADQKTCPVCLHMLGQTIDVKVAANKLNLYLDTHDNDPDAYVGAFPFPRLPDVDNISPKEIEDKGFFPPYHPRCRHQVVFLK